MKNLSQIPRNFSAKFCYGLEFSDHFEDETKVADLKNEKITEELGLKDVQTIAPKITEEERNAAEKNDRQEAEKIADKLLKDTKITEAANHDSEVAYDIAANKNLNLANAIEETEKLLANLNEEVSVRGFGNMDFYS